MHFIRLLRRVTAPLARIGELIAAAAMFAIMLVAVCDVTARYAFNAPLPWSFDLIMWILMPMVFFFALGSTGLRRDHVDIDVLYRRWPSWAQRASLVVGLALSVVTYAYIVYLGAQRSLAAWRSGELMNSALEAPTWIYLAFVPIGFALLVLVLAQQTASAALGEPLPQPHGEADGAGAR